jgi:hypothetical protein
MRSGKRGVADDLSEPHPCDRNDLSLLTDEGAGQLRNRQHGRAWIDLTVAGIDPQHVACELDQYVLEKPPWWSLS